MEKSDSDENSIKGDDDEENTVASDDEIEEKEKESNKIVPKLQPRKKVVDVNKLLYYAVFKLYFLFYSKFSENLKN